MARMNQAAGRTNAAWQKRYDAKRAKSQKLADQLGGEVVALTISGFGLPGGLFNRFDIKLPTGEVLTYKQAARRAAP